MTKHGSMKQYAIYLIMKVELFLVLFLIIGSSCNFLKDSKRNVLVDKPDYIHSAIEDFVDCKLFNEVDVYYIRIDTFNNDSKLIGLSIFQDNNPYYSYSEKSDNLKLTYLPQRYAEVGNSLFLWHDYNYLLTEEILTIYNKYNLLVPTEDSENNILDIPTDDAQKAAHYYFCLYDPVKFKRKITNIAIGFYDPPNIKCDT